MRSALVGVIGTGAMAGAMLFGTAALALAEPTPAAPPPPPPGCTAADLAQASGTVGTAMADYMFSHPDVNNFFTGLRGLPNEEIRARPYDQKPYWELERSRLGDTRKVPVELVVNGVAVARQEITADGVLRPIAFDYKVDRSSWIAMRILPSSHTNPIFALVGDKPIRASKASAEWCLRAVDQCWRQKEARIRIEERGEAQRAYEFARSAYRQRIKESE